MSDTPKKPPRPVYIDGTGKGPVLAPARWVKMDLFTAITGYTEKAVRRKIEEGIWLEHDVWIHAAGTSEILLNLEGYYRWVEGAKAPA